jgi:hypothetical protein
MQDTDGSIRRSLHDRLITTYGEQRLQHAVRELATDLIGATDPADLPPDCRAWVEGAIREASATAARSAVEQLVAELASRFAAAPDDLGQCDLMQAVARAQAIHVIEVR